MSIATSHPQQNRPHHSCKPSLKQPPQRCLDPRPFPGNGDQLSAERTCIPALAALLSVAHPDLVPGVSEVYEQDQLDEDEHEGAHDTKVEPHCTPVTPDSEGVKERESMADRKTDRKTEED